MNSIDNILMDDSDNDSLLTKELGKLIISHKNKNLTIDKSFIVSVFSTILKNYTSITLNNISFDDEQKILGFYFEGSINLCINNIVQSFSFKKHYDVKGVGCKKMLGYFEIITTIIHEITHLKQDDLVIQGIQPYYESFNELFLYYYDHYSINYEIIPCERYAELKGQKIAINALSYAYDSNELLALKVKYLDTLLSGYEVNSNEIISPTAIYWDLEKFLDLSIHHPDFDNVISLYDRLYHGLDISVDEYYHVFDLFSFLKNNPNNKDSVRTLVNNCNKH